MKILIFSAYDPIPSDNTGLLRYALLAQQLLKLGHEVLYITSSFFHLKKVQRNGNWSQEGTPAGLQLKLIDTRPYLRHMGMKRLQNHKKLAKGLLAYLQDLKANEYPDLIVCAIPPLQSALALNDWAREKKIPFVTDVQDLWPEEFEKLLPKPHFKKIFLKPMYNQAKQLVMHSSALAAVSADYLNHYRMYADNLPREVFHLGTDTKGYRQPAYGSSLFVMLGHSQGAGYMIPAAEAALEIQGAQLLVAGQGENSWKAKAIADSAGWQHVDIIPWLQKEEMHRLLPLCAAGIAIVSPASYCAFPNRALTYLAAGLPIISNIRGGELEEFIKKNKAGLTLPDESPAEIARAMRYVLKNFPQEERERLQALAQVQFQNSSIYEAYALWLEKLKGSQLI